MYLPRYRSSHALIIGINAYGPPADHVSILRHIDVDIDVPLSAESAEAEDALAVSTHRRVHGHERLGPSH